MLERLRRRTARSGLDVIMINIWEGVAAAAEARHFADVWGLEGTILLDETGQYADRLGIRGVPCNVAVDSAGLVRAVGAATPAELHQVADGLLAGRPDHPAGRPGSASSLPGVGGGQATS